MRAAWLLAGLLCAGCAAPGAPSSPGAQDAAEPQQSRAADEPIYFAIDLAANPEFRALLRSLAEEQPGLAFWAATLDNGYRQALGGDPACGAPADDWRYRWANLCRVPGVEAARLAVDQPDTLLGLPDQDVLAMTSAPEPHAPIMLETSTVHLPKVALQVTLRASRLALPADFAGEPEGDRCVPVDLYRVAEFSTP